MYGGFSRLRQRHDKVFGTPALKNKKRQAGTYMVPACRFFNALRHYPEDSFAWLSIYSNASNEPRGLSETLLSASELQVFGIFEFCAVRGGSGFPLRCPRL